jgi:Asp-tRNA(Asn)/Glu-tRNA(Gln) amidotransferase A subunit family amidase
MHVARLRSDTLKSNAPQAAASTARYAAGRPLSVLDGVPYAVKDAIDAYAFKTGSGTTFLGDM